MTNNPKPTESELEILLVMWQIGQCTVRDVHDELAKNKDTGYTTTLKVMQNMLEKGLIERENIQNKHLYKAVFSREQAQASALDKIISTVFKGSAAELIVQALGQHKASKDELSFIKSYLQNMDPEK